MLTRKYCMNCGASLLTYGRKQESTKKYSVLHDSRIITRRPPTIRREPEDTKPWDSFEISTDDNFVKPSEIAKDRIRHLRTPRTADSELEKARLAFERADAVGIDESGTGVIETRMLRASEVRELLGDWGPTEEQIESSTIVDSSPQPPSHLHPSEPTREEMEQHFLGSQSALTNLGYTEKQEIEAPVSHVARSSDDFSSTLYHTDHSQHIPEPETSERVELKPTMEVQGSELPSESIDVSAESTPWTVICPDCGKTMHSDLYEYPTEVYSQMGNARLKQAKYLFIQGKPDEARKAARLSRLLFEKAKDERGMIQQVRLERLLGPSK